MTVKFNDFKISNIFTFNDGNRTITINMHKKWAVARSRVSNESCAIDYDVALNLYENRNV